MRIVKLCCLIVLLAAGQVSAAPLTVMISGGFSAALDKLAPEYSDSHGDTLKIVHGPSMGRSPQAIPNRLARGEKADVVIMVGYALDGLIKQGKIMPGTRTELADSRIGAVVRAGDAKPDIASVEALRQTLLNAKSVAWSDSASGRYVQDTLLNQLGVKQALGQRGQMVERVPVASQVASGKYQIGFQQVSELLPVKGVTFIGKIPESVQKVTRFAGAVPAGAEHADEAKALLRYLASKEVQSQVRATGLDSVPAT